MRVVSLEEKRHSSTVGKEKFVTFSSWTLVMCVAYFLLAIIDQIISIWGSDIGFISSLQTITFVTGIYVFFDGIRS